MDKEKYCFSENSNLFTRNYQPKAGDTVMDIGSGVGEEICFFSTAVGESGHVYAIEADPTLYKRNIDLVSTLGLKNVTCINVAIMDKTCSVKIGRHSDDGIDSSIYAKNPRDFIIAPARSIDELLDEYGIDYLDYVKINIEGAESFAVQGVKDLSRIKNWCISTHDFRGMPTKKFVVDFFTSKGVSVDIHEEVEFQPHKGGYLYITQ